MKKAHKKVLKKVAQTLDDFMTVEEAATRKSCSPQGIRKAIKEQRLPAERKGRYWLIKKTEFDKFMRSAV